jgi:hypothetical protein
MKNLVAESIFDTRDNHFELIIIRLLVITYILEIL